MFERKKEVSTCRTDKILSSMRKTEKKIMPKVIFPHQCMMSTLQSPKSVPMLSVQ